jgi:mannitol operon transcriptional antiterminator
VYISARERKIIEALLLKEEGTTVKELANELEVSSRTVHRDLKAVEDILKEYDLTLKKKSGIGIQVVGEEEKKKHLHLFLFNLSHTEYIPEERQTIILSALLEATEPVKLMSIANDLNVTIPTISNDLNKVSEYLRSFGLSLIRKRGYGVEVHGSEAAKRRAISSLIFDNLDEFQFLSILKENIQKKSTQSIDTITDRLLGLVDKKKLLTIEKQVESIKDELPYSIADSAYIGLVVHLALAVERIHHGESINFDPKYLQSMKNTKEFKIALKIIEDLEKVFNIKIPYDEVGYITMHLMGAKLRHDKDSLLEETSFQVGIKAQNLIRYVSKELQHDLTKNLSLFQDLVTHLRPAIYRIKQNMRISNPLLPKIENDYAELFSICELGVKKVFPELVIPKEEIGYLVVHFASALLNKEEEFYEVSALVICSSGIGTSKILATKLQQEIQEIKTIKNISVFDLDKVNPNDFEIVISTIPLNHFLGDYILVSPILSSTDIDRIKGRIKDRIRDRLKKSHSVLDKKQENNNLTDGNHFVKYISLIQKYSTAIHNVLDYFVLKKLNIISSVDQALRYACDYLLENKVIKDSDIVIKHLLEREQLGGLGIPNTSLALYHTRSSEIVIPSFTIYRMDTPLVMKAMDNSQTEINTILLMLSPENANDETLEVLSYISSLIIRSEETIQLFELKNESDIFSYLANNLEDFFENKLEEIRSV